MKIQVNAGLDVIIVNSVKIISQTITESFFNIYLQKSSGDHMTSPMFFTKTHAPSLLHQLGQGAKESLAVQRMSQFGTKESWLEYDILVGRLVNIFF